MNSFQTTTLGNGLRVICLQSDSQVVYCGYQIAVGTRHEMPGEEGLAHFVEHTTFKGTQRRNALQIINALESVGGELNAYTNKQSTAYYAALPKMHFMRGVDLLTDIVFFSTYPEMELEKEKEVIVEEIESYHDSPAELIYDEFENLLFRGHPLGHNILGTAERVRSFTTADAIRFTQRYYRPDHAVFFVYGDVDFKKLVRKLEKLTAACDRKENCQYEEKQPAVPDRQWDDSLMPWKGMAGEAYVKLGHTHQAHVMIGTKGYPVDHPDRIALYLLNNLLGGPGMNARLNLSLRERNGLVYTVESTMTAYPDTGAWGIYFGCDHDDVRKCVRLVHRELEKLRRKTLSERQLAMAKTQIKGQIAIACDNKENFALDFGKTFLHYGRERDIDRLYRQIDQVTVEQLQRVANDLFQEDDLTSLLFTTK